MSTLLSEDELFDLIEEYPSAFLTCRDMSHDWYLVHDYRLVDIRQQPYRKPRGGFSRFAERELKCARCQMVRSDAYSISTYRGHSLLEKIGSGYTPPPGYQLKGIGRRRGLPAIIRGAAFERAMAA